MSEKQKETTIFDSRLREDEYVIWWGNVASGNNYLNPGRYFALTVTLMRRFISILSRFAILLTAIAFVAFIIGDVPLTQLWQSEEIPQLIGLIIVIVVASVLVEMGSLLKPSQQKEGDNRRWDVVEDNKHKHRILSPWTKNQYATTNQRVLLYEDGNFQETSLILMQDAVKTKPRNGKANINLYNKRSPTGQLPAPIATLNNLSEEDAETAYDFLVKARDLSFEERIEDLGLE